MRTVRQGISLPTTVAAQVRAMASARRLGANRMLLEQIENGIAVRKAETAGLLRTWPRGFAMPRILKK
jgi:hypothetical protein